MMRYLIFIPLIVWLAACSTGDESADHTDEDAVVNGHLSYTGPTDLGLDRPAERTTSACPEAMPTGGTTGSPHEVAGPLFCDY